MPDRRALLASAIVMTLASSCGARSELLASGPDGAPPDAGPPARDAGLPRGRDAGLADACVPRRQVLEPAPIVIAFVVDRSESMRSAFDGMPPEPGEPARWEAFAEAMAVRAPVLEEAGIAMGLYRFPIDTGCTLDGSFLPPLGASADSIVAALREEPIDGGSPVRNAIRIVLDRLDRSRAARFIVLSTDGSSTCPRERRETLESIVNEVEIAHAFRGIDVFVVGSSRDPDERSALDAIAQAGGRARVGSDTAFHDAQSAEAVDGALASIAAELDGCVLSLPTSAPEGAAIRVLAGAAEIPHDEDREDGWDWLDPRRVHLTFSGASCATARSATEIRAEIGCGP